MRNETRTCAACLIVSLSVAACGGNAAFVTTTSVGIDLDGNTQNVSLAYRRQEGYIGPTYEDGTPSVVATLESDGKIFTPKISQAYATGEAAEVAVGVLSHAGETSSSDSADSGSKTMYFGTNTTTGFKLGFVPASAIPNELVLGYKRQEASFIPIRGDEKTYAPTLAFYSMRRTAERNAGFSDKQFFATGKSAVKLAEHPAIRELFESKATESALAVWGEMTAKQDAVALRISICYLDIPFQTIPSAWSDAAHRELITGSAEFTRMAESKYEEVAALAEPEASKKQNLFRKDGKKGPSEFYLNNIRNHDDTEGRLDALIEHSRIVCKLASK
jgi:hypothetical protein